MHKQVIKKHNKILQNVEASPQGYLIITKYRFAPNSADAIAISYYSKRLEIRPQTPNDRLLF